jgi:hypothetical protein
MNIEKLISKELLENSGWLLVTNWFRYEIWRNEDRRLLLCPIEAEQYQVHMEYEV